MTSPTSLHFTSLAPQGIVDEVVRTYVVAAQKLGFSVTCERAAVRHDAVNIICFALALDPRSMSQLGPSIVLNFEPLVEGSQAYLHTPYIELLRKHYVWEYSTTNLQQHPALGIANGHYVPLGYEEEADLTLELSDLLPESARDIDVLFFGGPNERRENVVESMRRKGLNVVTNGSMLWEPEVRNAFIRRAKLVLNMHRFDNSRIVELPRVSMLLRQRKAVLCELYPDSEFPPELRAAVAGASLDQLADMAMLLVGAPSLRHALEARGLEILRQRSQSAILAPALSDYFKWRTTLGQ